MKPDIKAAKVNITFVSPDGKRYTPDEFFAMLQAEKDKREREKMAAPQTA